jgi:hypothetical protein
MTALRESEAVFQVTEVVHLAIEDDLHRAILIAHGLAPERRQINHRQPPVAKANLVIMPGSAVIGTTMCQHISHPVNKSVVLITRRRTNTQNPADATHASIASR